MDTTVKLIEAFVTYQGEGPDTGKRMMILRFKRCNRRCSWCDTLTKMEVSMETEYKLKDIQKEILSNAAGIMITGGEPTFNSKENDNFSQTVSLLTKLNYTVANVETNGYKLIDLIDKIKNLDESIFHFTKFVYSPKLFTNADLSKAIEITEEVKDYPFVFFKIVYDPFLLTEDFLRFLQEKKINERIFLMPEGKTKEKLLSNAQLTLEACERYKFNFSSRQHIIFDFT